MIPASQMSKTGCSQRFEEGAACNDCKLQWYPSCSYGKFSMGKVVLNPANEPIICKHSSVFGLGSMNIGNILQLVIHS